MAVYNRHGTRLDQVYDRHGTSLNNAYGRNGNEVFTRYKPVYTEYTEESYCSAYVNGSQGFDIHNGIAFQCYGTGKLATIDLDNNIVMNTNLSVASGHNNGASFSNEFYSSDDAFPLFYVCADNNIVAHRVTKSSAGIYKKYSYTGDNGIKLGDGGLGFDFINGVAYTFTYSTHSWTSSADDNKVVVTKVDFKNAVDNGNGTYVPVVLAQYEYPFVYCIQSPHFHDGLFWLPSGNGGSNQHIYGMNPETGEIVYTINVGSTTEIEGVTFISDFEMVYGLLSGGYRKITFGKQLVTEA